MSVTDPRRTSPEVDVRDRDRTVVIHSDRTEHDHRETRPFPRTSEFWAFVVGIAAIAAIYNAADDTSFDLWRACLLGTVLGVAYIVSRGFAKAGTHHDDRDRRSAY
jgi:hypothetical protein